MKVTFLGLGTEQLGISQLSAIAKQHGHTTNIAFSAQLFNDRFNLQFPQIAKHFDDTQDAVDTIIQTNPDVVAFGALTSTYQWGLEVAEKAKLYNPDIKVVFGGVHPSAVPDLVLQRPQVDFVVVGEGDIAFPKILTSIENQDFQTPIINTRFKTPSGQVIRGTQGGFIQDLDSLPFYDKTIWEDYVRIGDIYLTMATRGCPYRCSFCFNNFFAKLPEEKSGKYVRLRSVEHVIEELKQAKKRYNLKIIDFQDDVFGTQKKWLRDFTYLYKKEINLPFQILTHPKFMDEETGRLLSSAGCKWIQMGVQSMDDDFKKDSLLRYEKSEDIEKSLQVMHKYNMKVKVDHMFGLPNEPVSAQENALNLYSNNHVQRIQTFWTCFLPGTALMNDAIEDGSLSPKQIADINEGRDFYFFRNTDNVKDKKLQDLYHAYEFLFRLIPALPFFVRRKLKPEHVLWIPKPIKAICNFFADIIIGFGSINPEFFAYLNHNLFHLSRFFMKRLFSKKIKATKPNIQENPSKFISKNTSNLKVENEI